MVAETTASSPSKWQVVLQWGLATLFAVTVLVLLVGIYWRLLRPATTTEVTVNAATATVETPLERGATYSSAPADTGSYPALRVVVSTDQTTNLQVQFSADQEHWDVIVPLQCTGGNVLSSTVPVQGAFVRVVATNGTDVDQTYFRLHTTLLAQTPGTGTTTTVTTTTNEGTIVNTTTNNSTTNSTSTGGGDTGRVDDNNSTDTPLGVGELFTGTATDVAAFPTVALAIKTDQNATAYIDFSPDGTNWDSSLSYTVEANVNEVHRLSTTRQWMRVRLRNTGGSAQTFLRLQTLLGSQTALTSILNSQIQSDADAMLSRAVITGQNPNGNFRNVNVSAEGHLEVALHDPLLPFGSVHVETMYPVFQIDGVNGLKAATMRWGSSGTGASVAQSGSLLTVSSGTDAGGTAWLQTRKRLRYRPGQGNIERFTAWFDPPQADSYQVIGLGDSEDALLVGYIGTAFGVWRQHHGAREIRSLTVTSVTQAGTITLTLNDVPYTVTLTTTNIYRATWEIVNYTGGYYGWSACMQSNSVAFLCSNAGPLTGTFSIAAGTAILSAAFNETPVRTGVAPEVDFTAQPLWNGDTMDGTGASGVTADWTKGNVFSINMQYLGAGSIVFQAETCPNDSNNSSFSNLHTLRLPNTLDTSSLANPNMPFLMAASNGATNTTSVTVKTASAAGFMEGLKVLQGPPFTYRRELAATLVDSYYPLITLHNRVAYNSKTNQTVVNITSVTAAIKNNSPVMFYLVRSPKLLGNPVFNALSSESCCLYDVAATGITLTSTEDTSVVWTAPLGDTGHLEKEFDIQSQELTIQPGERISLVARNSASQSASFVTVSINTREDQ